MTDLTVAMPACKECGSPLPARSRTSRMYCSIACKRRASRGAIDNTLTCKRCETSFISRNPKAKYCSAECREPGLARTCDTEGCGRPHRARGLCSMCWKRTYGQRTTYSITCVVCETETQSARPDGKYCSDACKGWEFTRRGMGPHCAVPERHPAHPRWTVERRLPVLWIKPARIREKPISPVRRWYSGQCQRCSTWFITDQPAGRYCTIACQRRDAKGRRRARKKDAFVAPVYRNRIFERDGWRCQLCGNKVKRDAEVPHPLAPVLDHIVPLAKGGSHEPANVQCAHFLCNSLKSDKGAPQQLMLIG